VRSREQNAELRTREHLTPGGVEAAKANRYAAAIRPSRVCDYVLAWASVDHRTTVYSALAPNRFKDFCRD
jgi:hypothetical protein